MRYPHDVSETDTPQFGRAMTLEEWADLDEDQEGELVDGRLEEEEMTTMAHEVVVAWTMDALRRWLQPQGGWVLASQHKLAVSPRRGRIPDVVAYFPGRPVPAREAKLATRPPDVAIEVVSTRPRDARRDRVDKKADYGAWGLPAYWIIDPRVRLLEVLQLGPDGRYVDALSATNGTHDIPGCPGLQLDLDALWAEVDRLPESDDAG
jgi:Uma2 family endonuclease